MVLYKKCEVTFAFRQYIILQNSASFSRIRLKLTREYPGDLLAYVMLQWKILKQRSQGCNNKGILQDSTCEEKFTKIISTWFMDTIKELQNIPFFAAYRRSTIITP